MVPFDLHMHSCYSKDGEKTPQELIALAKEAGLTTIALSDHNTPKGIDALLELGKMWGIRVIPAMEFDTLFEGLEVHVLGYGMDYHQDYFQSLEDALKERKAAAIEKRLKRLNDYYHMEVTPEEVIAKYGKKQLWPNIIRYILEDPRYMHIKAFDDYRQGGPRSVPQSVNFYWDLCSPQTPCYVRVEYPSLQETVKRIHEAGGIAIIAHPWRNFFHQEERLSKALSQGIDGLEAYSNYHSQEQNAYYEAYCLKHHILMTCGSDYHGKFKPNIEMGQFGYTKDTGIQHLNNFLKSLTKGLQ